MNLVSQAEKLCDRQLQRIAPPTLYIAGFRTAAGDELALERHREALFCWAQPRTHAGAPCAPWKVYPASKSRNSNLNAKNCPRLKAGASVHYWKFDSLDVFERFLAWYSER
jgi:hypothetical protein